MSACPCGRPQPFEQCCGRFIKQGHNANNAETLMRSRYSAYVLAEEAYLLRSWHPKTRPDVLNLQQEPPCKWLGLSIKQFQVDANDTKRAVVEFIARYKINGRAFKLHETSRFECLDGQWFYIDGDIHA